MHERGLCGKVYAHLWQRLQHGYSKTRKHPTFLRNGVHLLKGLRREEVAEVVGVQQCSLVGLADVAETAAGVTVHVRVECELLECVAALARPVLKSVIAKSIMPSLMLSNRIKILMIL